MRPQTTPPMPSRLTVSAAVAQANKIHDVAPVYPAFDARVSGTVRLAIVIGKDGKIIDIKLISGHPLLVPAAFEAVKQWEYRPTLLNGQPVEVATEASVNFTLQ